MRTYFLILISIIMFSCNANKTVFLSNKTGKPITLTVDSSYANHFAFKDSLDGVRIEKKKVFDFGKGKWTKEDKANLEELLQHTKMIEDGSSTATDLPAKTKISYISFNVEELWVNIK